MLSLTEENYLKAIFHLSPAGNHVSLNELSKALGIKMSTVTAMMKKLSQKGLLEYATYKPVNLTEQGRIEAALVIRRHRLTEMFLVEVMEFSWDQVHEIAEQMEHIRSSVFFDKMDTILGHPSTDPHGSPIPDKDGKIKKRKEKMLSECKEGDEVKISSVRQGSDEFLRFLSQRKLHLGLALTVKKIEPFDGSMRISIPGRRQEFLSRDVCEKLMVAFS
jgi:DtxR family Mn-dependent transcriptional regulator